MITFIQPQKSFLPGLQAYRRYLTQHRIPFQIIGKDETIPSNTLVEWHFMGTDYRKERSSTAIVIHEYCSLSTPPFAVVKNFLKKMRNLKPDFRVFSNELIRKDFNFEDGVTSFIREVGVDTKIFTPVSEQATKEYDFIYVGTVDPSRKLHKLLDLFTQSPLNQSSLLIVSKNYDILQKKYQSHRNIKFEGPISTEEVAQRIHASRYAINYIPEVYPFNIQASTKFLEYAACEVPILTTHSNWLREFERDFGGNYYYFNDKQPYFIIDDLIRYKFSAPSVKSLEWENCIEQSGILKVLFQKVPDLFKDSNLQDTFQ